MHCAIQQRNLPPPAHSRTVHLDIIKVLLATDAQENCFKRGIKIYINPYPANVENMVSS